MNSPPKDRKPPNDPSATEEIRKAVKELPAPKRGQTFAQGQGTKSLRKRLHCTFQKTGKERRN